MNWSKTVAKSGTPIKLLIGGSPCTKWSIAQKNGREVLPEGIGWELRELSDSEREIPARHLFV